MSNLYIRITRPEGYEDVHPDLILQDMNINPVWGAEVVDVEAVLRECREALECVPKHFGMKRLGKSTLKDSETRVMCHKAIAKIDEALNVPDSSRTA